MPKEMDVAFAITSSESSLSSAESSYIGRVHTTYLIRISLICIKLIQIKLHSHWNQFDPDRNIAFTLHGTT